MHNISVKCQSYWHWNSRLTFFEKDSKDEFQLTSTEMHFCYETYRMQVKTEECKQEGKK